VKNEGTSPTIAAPWRRLCLFLVAATLALAGALDPHFPFGLADYDWAFHLLAFSVLTIIGAWIGWPLSVVVLIVGGASALIEVAQGLVPTRTVSTRDIFLNVAGIAIGMAIVLSMRALWRQRRQRRE